MERVAVDGIAAVIAACAKLDWDALTAVGVFQALAVGVGAGLAMEALALLWLWRTAVSRQRDEAWDRVDGLAAKLIGQHATGAKIERLSTVKTEGFHVLQAMPPVECSDDERKAWGDRMRAWTGTLLSEVEAVCGPGGRARVTPATKDLPPRAMLRRGIVDQLRTLDELIVEMMAKP